MQQSLGSLPTVCAAANCPNIGECWQRGTATFMIMGELCTRGCRFCNVATGQPQPLNPQEPQLLADSVAQLQLRYAVLTCVDRDDLPDSGAAHWAACIGAVRKQCPQVGIEALVGDFRGSTADIATVVQARPDVFAHNVEVVPRLQSAVRPAAAWETSCGVLKTARRLAEVHEVPLLIKSGLMLGLGESLAEVREALVELRSSGAELLTLGQYLKPSHRDGKLDVQRYVTPQEFAGLADFARSLGFAGVAAGPLTRSSHLAETLYADARAIQQ